MDFVFHCQRCHGPLIARIEWRGRTVPCAHCTQATAAPSAAVALTESIVSLFLDAPAPAPARLLRRIRLPVHAKATVRFTSSRSRPAYPRGARISHDR